LELVRKSALAHHIHRFTRLDEWVLITAIWYERVTGATMQ